MKNIRTDTKGIAPIIWFFAVAFVGIAGVSAFQFFQRPDITTNITDTGFAIAGIDFSWILVIGIVVIFVFLFLILRRRPSVQRFIPPAFQRPPPQ